MPRLSDARYYLTAEGTVTTSDLLARTLVVGEGGLISDEDAEPTFGDMATGREI